MLEHRRWVVVIALCALTWACGGDDDDDGDGSTADAGTAADAGGDADASSGDADASSGDADASSGGADASSADASGAACGSIPVEPLGPSGVAEGSIAAGDGGLTSPGCGGDGAEVIYTLTIEETTSLDLTLEAEGFDAVVSVRRDCLDEDSEVVCAAAPFGSLTVGPLEPGTYYLVVDGATPEASGAFTVSARPSPEEQSCVAASILSSLWSFGTLVDRHAIRSSCAPAGAAAENVYEVPVPILSSLTVLAKGIGISPDPTVSIRAGDCGDPAAELSCSAAGEPQIVQDPPPGPYYVVVEGGYALAHGLTMTGTIPLGAPCDPYDPRFECDPGSGCGFDDRFCAVHACSDGIDNDGNGQADHPEDAGCATAADDAEDAACPGPSCPACADGVDNDGDGQTDYPEDTTCLYAGQYAESIAACGNGRDDDGDALVDDIDPGCLQPSDESEIDACPEDTGCRACSDGIDNDGDGLIDWPAEPGCRLPSSFEEIDDCPHPARCPGCSNGRDDDQNGQTDYPEDQGCGTAYSGEGFDCQESDPYVLVTGPVMTGTTVGATDDRSLELLRACYDDEQEFGAPDVVLVLPLPGLLNYLRVDSSGSDFDPIVGIGENTCSGIYSCEEGPQETEVVAGGFGSFAYIHVDGSYGASGNYVLEIEGIIAPNEGCDQAQIDAGILTCEAPTLCVEAVCQ